MDHCFYMAFSVTISSLFSQITVDQSDMPAPGDTLRVSLTNAVPAGYAKTAMDTTWNYAALEALSQRVDTFVSATSTPYLFFVLLTGANLATPRNSSPVPGLPLSQGYTFYKNSSGAYSELGSAFTVQGWGNLTTPYGSFQTLRVRSTLAIRDSIFIDSLQTGFPINRDIIEYKWLAKRKGITGGTPPYQVIWNTLDTGTTISVIVQDIQTYSILVVDALQNFGMAQKMVSVIYPPGIGEPEATQLHVYPNPSVGPVRLVMPEITGKAIMQVVSSHGKILRTQIVVPAAGIVQANLSDLPDGLFFIHITTEKYTFSAKLQLLR